VNPPPEPWVEVEDSDDSFALDNTGSDEESTSATPTHQPTGTSAAMQGTSRQLAPSNAEDSRRPAPIPKDADFIIFPITPIGPGFHAFHVKNFKVRAQACDAPRQTSPTRTDSDNSGPETVDQSEPEDDVEDGQIQRFQRLSCLTTVVVMFSHCHQLYNAGYGRHWLMKEIVEAFPLRCFVHTRMIV
jgi:hypothetical protein